MKRLRNMLATLRARRRAPRDRESGVALLITISSLTLLISLVAEFSYGTTIQLAQAANARDELRAHYMARSAVSLSRLLIRIQKRFVDPIMQQAQQMMKAGGMGDLGISLRVTDYAAPLMSFFGGSKDEAAGLGSLIGIDVSKAKGLGMKTGKLDAEISVEDGKIDINCGSGMGNGENVIKQNTVFRLLSSVMYSPRYNRLFQKANADGQFTERMDLARAIIDWADQDEQGFSGGGVTGGGAEDYRYDARKDPYRAHNNPYDTLDEVRLVRGMTEEMTEAFSPYLTVYPTDASRRCRVNLASIKGDCTPLLVGLIRAAAQPDPTKPPTDPQVFDDDRVYPLASILCERGSAVGFDSLDTIVNVMSNPATSISREDPRAVLMQSMRGINITRAALESVAYVDRPRMYKIVASGSSGKVKKKITVVLDTARIPNNLLTINAASERASGVVQYWREE